jgi:hypothetical protein
VVLEVQLEFAAKNNYTAKIQLLGIPDEFIEHGTVDELQEYCKIDVKSLEIVFLLSQNNYFALLKHNAPIMKLLSLFLLVLLFSENTFSQKLLLPRWPKKIEPDTLSHWIKNKIGFDISEIVFVNWNAGGTSSISGL